MNIDKNITFELSHKKQKQALKTIKDQFDAKVAARNFLEQYPDINVGFVVEELKSNILSTNNFCTQLGISHAAFARLRKKYGIEPVYVAKKSKGLAELKPFVGAISKFATKNYYTNNQIKRIPVEEITLVQMRAARSLKFPNGHNKPVKWKPRGSHKNGKLKARTDVLEKFGVRIFYNDKDNTYTVFKDDKKTIMSRREVDVLNNRYNKLKVFT